MGNMFLLKICANSIEVGLGRNVNVCPNGLARVGHRGGNEASFYARSAKWRLIFARLDRRVC